MTQIFKITKHSFISGIKTVMILNEGKKITVDQYATITDFFHQ